MEVRNVIIIGSGPAGLTAALYSSRANLNPLCFEGSGAGGQLMTTTDVENYPGFPEGIMGPALMEEMSKQAARFGTELVRQDVEAVDFSRRPFKVTSHGQDYYARAVIIATGASPRHLGLSNEMKLTGRGVSTCATCDGAFFRDEDLAVVGGGDSAIEEATFLTRFARSVQLIHRRAQLRASKIMQDRAFNTPKLSFIWNSVVTGIFDDDKKVTGIQIQDLDSKKEKRLDVGGVFVAIGHIPNTQLFEGQIELDAQGYIVTKNGSSATSVEGVFAGGDCVDHVYRQAVTAAGMGCAASIDAERWLAAHEHELKQDKAAKTSATAHSPSS